MSNVTVAIGEDDYLVEQAARKAILPGGELEVVDSNTATNEELQLKDLSRADAGFSTPPFLEPAKTTWWRNVRFLPQGGRSASSEGVKAALEKFAAKIAASPLPPNQAFILSGPKLLMTSVFAKTLKPVATFAVFTAGKPWEAARQAVERVADMAKDEGLKFERGAAEAFVARVGTDTRSLMSELAKLRDYVGPVQSTLTAADIAEVTSTGIGVEPAVWDVTDALGERNAAKAIAAARRFETEDGFAVLMATVCEKLFRQLAALKDAERAGRLDEAAKGMNAFVLRKNRAFLAKWTLTELRVAWRRFMALREKCVSTGGSADALVIAEIARACAPAGKGKP